MECSRILKPTDINYKIICAGSGFDIGQDKPVNVSFQGRLYQAKMHSKTKGRIDGLSQLYADFGFTEGQEIRLAYHEGTNTIEITDPFEMPFDDDSEGMDETVGTQGMPGGAQATGAGEKTDSQSEIYDIFSRMDPVVSHQEYYSPARPLSVAVNRGWIVYGGNNWGDGFWLMNEDTLEKIPLNVSGRRYDTFLGANHAGLWFMEYGGGRDKWGNEVPGKLIFTGGQFGGETVIRFNKKKASISTPYIYGLDAYYIAHISDNKESLMTVDIAGNEWELFVAHKGESIKWLSVGAEGIAFHLSTYDAPEKTGWYVLKKGSAAPPVFLNRQREEGSSGRPAIEIHRIFLDKKVMWTEVTAREAAKYGISGGWICRPLGEPKEGSFLVYKDSSKPVLWGVSMHSDLRYFDGRAAYEVPHYGTMKRIQADGSEITLYSGGHGECDGFVVSDKYLYGNFDAVMPVRVPKLFRQPEVTGCVAIRDYETGDVTIHNPEAEAIWGTEDIRF